MGVLFLNPYTVLIDCAKEIKPDISCKIYFVRKLKGCKGVTIFPDDNGISLVQIDSRMPIPKSIDILAHELAHVINPEDGHGEKWADTYDILNTMFNEHMTRVFKDMEEI